MSTPYSSACYFAPHAADMVAQAIEAASYAGLKRHAARLRDMARHADPAALYEEAQAARKAATESIRATLRREGEEARQRPAFAYPLAPVTRAKESPLLPRSVLRAFMGGR